MSTAKIPASASAGSQLTTALWLAALAVGVYFVASNVPRYLIWSKASYGPYFWPRATTLLPHVLGGLVALVMGPFQFWPRIRNNYPKVHRISGRVYLAAVLLGASSGMAMAVTSGINFSYASGLFALAVVWLSTSGMAVASILRRDFVQHKEWMVRSYVVTFAFVTFRVADHTLGHFRMARAEYLAMLAWACWAIPLLFTEMAIQGRQVFARR